MAAMVLDGVEYLPIATYFKISEIEAVALRYGYKELQAPDAQSPQR